MYTNQYSFQRMQAKEGSVEMSFIQSQVYTQGSAQSDLMHEWR